MNRVARIRHPLAKCYILSLLCTSSVSDNWYTNSIVRAHVYVRDLSTPCSRKAIIGQWSFQHINAHKEIHGGNALCVRDQVIAQGRVSELQFESCFLPDMLLPFKAFIVQYANPGNANSC